MLLDRLQRSVRGVRFVRRGSDDPENSPFRIQIVPLRPLDVGAVERIKKQLSSEPGPIVTTALVEREQRPFLDAGFQPRERLHLLSQTLPADRTPSAARTGVAIRAGRRGDVDATLEIDRRSFDSFWVFDRDGLASARRATPIHRYAVAHIDNRVVGYCVTGKAGTTGFLQRLGVDPDYRRQGIAGQLIDDSRAWAVRQSAQRILVNTQEINEGALALYLDQGFTLEADKLAVLEWVR